MLCCIVPCPEEMTFGLKLVFVWVIAEKPSCYPFCLFIKKCVNKKTDSVAHLLSDAASLISTPGRQEFVRVVPKPWIIWGNTLSWSPSHCVRWSSTSPTSTMYNSPALIFHLQRPLNHTPLFTPTYLSGTCVQWKEATESSLYLIHPSEMGWSG